MAECLKCGSQSRTFKEGISKKNNRPWRGYKCDDCGDMVFLKTKAPQNASNAKIEASYEPPKTSKSPLEAKIDRILAILEKAYPSVMQTIENEALSRKEAESTPF